MICGGTLQNITKGTAAIGSNTCRRMAPAAAENAKPEDPLTTPPRKTAGDSAAISAAVCIRVPGICHGFGMAADLLRAGHDLTERNAFIKLHRRFDLPRVTGLARFDHGKESLRQGFSGHVLGLAVRLDQRDEP